MKNLIEEEDLCVRVIQKGDELTLLKWLTDDKVLAYYEGRDRRYTLDKVMEDFFINDEITRCIVIKKGTPIGYVQFYSLNNVEEAILPNCSFGMDQFIGEPTYWNKGIGKRLIRMVVNYIVMKLNATLIVMDPQQWNHRAIACYKHVGFEEKCVLPKHEYHEGEWRDCLLMFYECGAFSIHRIQDHHQELVHTFLNEQWGSTEMVVSSGVYEVNKLEGFIATDKAGEIRGMITYFTHQDRIEIISFNSLIEKKGIGSRLLFEVEMVSRAKGLKKITVITTNDNIDALRFYQRKGYRLTRVIEDAVDLAREHKPDIPKIGHYHIPICDELILTKKLNMGAH